MLAFVFVLVVAADVPEDAPGDFGADPIVVPCDACDAWGDDNAKCVEGVGCVCGEGYGGKLCAPVGERYGVVFLMRWVEGVFEDLTDEVRDVILQKIVEGGVKTEFVTFVKGSVIVSGEAAVETNAELDTVLAMPRWLDESLHLTPAAAILGDQLTSEIYLDASPCPLSDGAASTARISDTCHIVSCLPTHSYNPQDSSCTPRHGVSSSPTASTPLILGALIGSLALVIVVSALCYCVVQRRRAAARKRRNSRPGSPRPFCEDIVA